MIDARLTHTTANASKETQSSFLGIAGNSRRIHEMRVASDSDNLTYEGYRRLTSDLAISNVTLYDTVKWLLFALNVSLSK